MKNQKRQNESDYILRVTAFRSVRSRNISWDGPSGRGESWLAVWLENADLYGSEDRGVSGADIRAALGVDCGPGSCSSHSSHNTNIKQKFAGNSQEILLTYRSYKQLLLVKSLRALHTLDSVISLKSNVRSLAVDNCGELSGPSWLVFSSLSPLQFNKKLVESLPTGERGATSCWCLMSFKLRF